MNVEQPSSSPPDLPPEVQKWLDEHPETDPEPLKEVWDLSQDAASTFEPDPKRVSGMRDTLLRAMETGRLQESGKTTFSGSTSPKSHRRRKRPSKKTFSGHRWGMGIAGSMLLLLVAIIVYFATPIRVTAPPGETHTATLPDGSQVELNSATTLRYPRWWTVELPRKWLGRQVHLDGETFFSVRDTGSPFHVETANAEARVLETQFNVRARNINGRAKTRVVVADGRVAVTAAGATTFLDSARTATVRGAAPPSSNEEAHLGRLLAWRQGGFAFTDASIQEISTEVERRFGIPIDVASGIQGRPVTLHLTETQGPSSPTGRLQRCRLPRGLNGKQG